MKKYLTKSIAVAGLVTAATLASMASAQTVIVDPSDSQGWFVKGVNPGVIPGTVALSATSPVGNPLGPGALELTLDGVDDQVVNVARISGLLVGSISEIKWSASSSTTELPVAKVEYWSPTRFGTLFAVHPAYPGDTSWVTLDGFSLQWYTTEPGFPSSKTFAEWQLELGGEISTFFSVGMGSSGSTSLATTAYADQVTLDGTVWNFEGAAPLPPVPEADVSLTKTLNTAAPFVVGDTIQYTLVVANAGPDPAVDVLIDDVPTNLTITSVASTNCSALPCTLASLASGASETVTLMAAIDSAGAFDNAAGAASEVTADPDYTNNADNTGNGGTADPVSGGPTPPPTAGPAAPVPTMSQWALIILGLMMAGIGITRMRTLTQG